MDKKEKLIEFIKIHGPSLPSKLSKEIESDILMTSAHLAELVSKKQLKLSALKVGSSPLYYLSGQEPSLQKFSDSLHEKAKKAYSLLSQKKILRDKALEPVIRVVLRELKDFAVPLQVTYENNKEIFWKWYLMDSKEAEEEIKKQLKIKKSEPKKEPEPVAKSPLAKKPEQEPIKKPLPVKVTKKPKKDLLIMVQNYFDKNKIRILNQEIVRKNSEIDFIIEIPSAVGGLTYYCKAKSKTRVSDSDLAGAFAKGQVKKLPVLILTFGDLTKKAKESLNDFKGMSIKKI